MLCVAEIGRRSNVAPMSQTQEPAGERSQAIGSLAQIMQYLINTMKLGVNCKVKKFNNKNEVTMDVSDTSDLNKIWKIVPK